MDPPQKHEKIKLVEINSYLTCYLCEGYLIDATTISECLHSFCRSCIIKFLQENCYCPVCEVIINKAKPCLKLDKTLQDIVYKLVPELFVKEMYRRKEFYQNRPGLAPKVSPEERGEDTERTIFNPQDAISLSIEYISDDSAPGAIPALPSLQKNGTQAQLEEPHDNPMKRYLQCPGMCRIEVLKKFVRNKYNVDTNLFHIDILYKRVPLPDHYTLIDIGYIYSWKRNEPMKFFFRITDINKVAERFDYFDGRTSPEVIQKPTRIRQSSDRDKTSRGERKKEAAAHNKEVKEETKPSPPAKEETARTEPEVKCEKSEEVKSVVKRNEVKSVKPEVKPVKDEVKSVTAEAKPIKDEVKSVKDETQQNKDEVILKPEITEEIKNKIQSGKSDIKNNVYTNITLNRDDNVEIITKIQKVSNKEGHPIGLNIINHTVKKTNKVQTSKNRPANNPKLVPTSSNVDNKTPSEREKKTEEATPKTEESRDRDREELEKSNFLKSIQLTAKNSLPEPKATTSLPKPMTSSQKRKNSSPVKNEKSQEKKTKIEKKPVKIIIQPKTIQNPAVRQMVTNVNQNVNNMSKIVEQSTTATKTTDLQSLIDNCKINIPSSLSITLNEGGEGGARTPPSIPPVKNYIEILKLPDSNKVEDKEKSKDKEEGKSEKTSPTLMSPAIKDKNRNIQTFQKIFEESIIKKSPEMTNNNNKSKAEGSKPTPLDLTSPNEGSKRKILEIASQLHKKTKLEQEKKKEEVTIGKIAIPRLATQRTLKPTSNKYDFGQNRPQTSASLHSSSLGLNYTVSVGQSEVKAPSPKRVAPSTSKAKPKSSPKGAGMSPNQLLEKYNIQNLAQLTASFNFNPANFGGGQFGALQHAMLLKQIEHQNWLNQGPLLQYEKYLQSLSASQGKLMGNIKEN